MMKRFLSIFLSLSLMAMTLSFPALAADEDPGGFLDKAKTLWGSAAETATSTYGTAAKALGEQADIWGNRLNDLLVNAGGAFSDAGAWVQAFVAEQGKNISATAGASYENLQLWLSETETTSLDVLHVAFNNVAASLGIVGDSATRLWETIEHYAEANNITPSALIKLSLAIMTMMAVNKFEPISKTKAGELAGEAAEDYIEETLTLWFDNFHITDQESADLALSMITESVDDYMDENSWVCKSCGEENHGNFCVDCGAKRPKKADTWKCDNCKEKNQGRFCANCGHPRPLEKDIWVCDECQEENTGNYCASCGSPCPAIEDTWDCEECGLESLGNFCTGCGSPRPKAA